MVQELLAHHNNLTLELAVHFLTQDEHGRWHHRYLDCGTGVCKICQDESIKHNFRWSALLRHEPQAA